MRKNEIFITCHPHIGPFLADEVRSLGYEILEEGNKGILTSGSYSDTIKFNLNLRTANRVLFKVGDFACDSPKELYNNALKIEWENIISANGYFSVDSSIRQSGITDTRFPNLKLKDAIVDRIRKKTNRRPNSGPFKDRTVVFLHWHNRRSRYYIDTSGETLSKHGYRINPYKAPMIESLAAATILASKWDPDTVFINPMCGSGTLAIEAALIAQKKTPGVFRSNFGFMHTKYYNSDEYRILRNEVLSSFMNKPRARIIATDISSGAIRAAKENARKAQIDKYIEFKICDFKDTEIPDLPGAVFLNPEYGERIGDIRDLEKTYSEIGDFFKQRCTGKSGFVFTGNLDLAKRIGLKTSQRTIFYNAKIECRLLKYELYSGSKKNKSE